MAQSSVVTTRRREGLETDVAFVARFTSYEAAQQAAPAAATSSPASDPRLEAPSGGDASGTAPWSQVTPAPSSVDPDFPRTSDQFALSHFLKDGRRLYMRYYIHSCPDDLCSSALICAVLRQSGRACGGKHSARTYWAKHAMTVETFQRMQLPAPASDAAEALGREERPLPYCRRDASGANAQVPSKAKGSAKEHCPATPPKKKPRQPPA